MEFTRQLIRKIMPSEEAVRVRKEAGKRKIVFCVGCFDILHSGHVVFLSQCKSMGDLLVVGIGRDETIKKQKGQNHPFNPLMNRAFLLAALGMVDYVVISGENQLPGKIDFAETVNALKPDIFVVNDDDSGLEEKRAFFSERNIPLRLAKRDLPKELEPRSSTEIINTLQKSDKSL